MRRAYPNQRRLDTDAINNTELNVDCRHEIIPILATVQYIFGKPELRDQVLELIGKDINSDSRRDIGRMGLDYWCIFVLASLRRGCNLDYDSLQDLAEQHRAVRSIMGIGEWDDGTSFNWRRIQRSLCLVKPETIDEISHLVVAEGHTLIPGAVEEHRVDSFVVETNIHYPTESSLILDGIGKVIELAVLLANTFVLDGWRQHEHLLKSIKVLHLNISRISRRKGANAKPRMEAEYRKLLKKAGRIIRRATELAKTVAEMESVSVKDLLMAAEIRRYIALTEQVMGTTRRRVLLDEHVTNEEKLFSIFETHTQLYRRGKAGQPNQFGRLVLVFEDGAGFITHHYVMSRTEMDAEVAVGQTKIVQERFANQIKEISFDRGFDDPANIDLLREIVPNVCLPKKHPKAYAEQMADEDETFKRIRRRHSGVESAIGALQSGNGLKRSADRTETGFRRYIALGVLGRNLHVLGKILIRARQPDAKAAFTKRKAA